MNPDDMFNDVREKRQQVKEMLINAIQLRDEGLTDKAIEIETEAKLLRNQAEQEEADAIVKENEQRRREVEENQ